MAGCHTPRTPTEHTSNMIYCFISVHCVYRHAYTYIYIYTHTYICVYLCLLRTCRCICIHTCTCTCICTCVRVPRTMVNDCRAFLHFQLTKSVSFQSRLELVDQALGTPACGLQWRQPGVAGLAWRFLQVLINMAVHWRSISVVSM